VRYQGHYTIENKILQLQQTLPLNVLWVQVPAQDKSAIDSIGIISNDKTLRCKIELLRRTLLWRIRKKRSPGLHAIWRQICNCSKLSAAFRNKFFTLLDFMKFFLAVYVRSSKTGEIWFASRRFDQILIFGPLNMFCACFCMIESRYATGYLLGIRHIFSLEQ